MANNFPVTKYLVKFYLKYFQIFWKKIQIMLQEKLIKILSKFL